VLAAVADLDEGDASAELDAAVLAAAACLADLEAGPASVAVLEEELPLPRRFAKKPPPPGL